MSRPVSRPRSRSRTWAAALAACVACAFAGPVWAQYATDYTYVRMSLTVPWTLYFVFLAGVLIPFIVTIVLAWRSAARGAREAKGSGEKTDDAGDAAP